MSISVHTSKAGEAAASPPKFLFSPIFYIIPTIGGGDWILDLFSLVLPPLPRRPAQAYDYR